MKQGIDFNKKTNTVEQTEEKKTGVEKIESFSFLVEDVLSELEKEFGNEDGFLTKARLLAERAKESLEAIDEKMEDIDGQIRRIYPLLVFNAKMIEFEGGDAKEFRRALYDPKFNDEREAFRELLIRKIQEADPQNTGEGKTLQHLERFLPFEEDAQNLDDSISKYLAKEYENSISRWISLELNDFKKYTLEELGVKGQEGLKENVFLKKTEEELASIKSAQVNEFAGKSISYKDREQKLKFIRDLRFDRVAIAELKKQLQEAKKGEVFDPKNIKKELGRHLKKHLAVFVSKLKETEGLGKEARKQALLDFVDGLGEDLQDDSKQEVVDFIEKAFD